MDKKVLVTGGLGYIGSHTVVRLIQKRFEPIILDNLSNSSLEVVNLIKKTSNKTPIFYNGDCRDPHILDEIFRSHKIEKVIHFAAFKYVGESVEKPLEYFDNNLGGLISLLKAMNRHGVNDLIFSSSCSVYGSSFIGEVDELAPLNPISPYAETKRMGEEIIKAEKSINCISLRYFNPIGALPDGSLGEFTTKNSNNILPHLLEAAKGKQFSVYGGDYPTPDGTCIRDYIHVLDVADAHILALLKIKLGFEVFNLGVGEGISVLELINLFEKTIKKKIEVAFLPRREGDVPSIYANCFKIKNKLNWKNNYSVMEALEHSWIWSKKIFDKS